MAYVGTQNLSWVTLCAIVPAAVGWSFLVAPYYSPLVGALFQLLHVCSVVLLGFAHLTEPGILPTQVTVRSTGTNGQTEVVPLDLGYMVLPCCGTKPPEARPQCYHVVVLDGERRHLRDFRAKVCRETEVAVEKFDHFCPWVGNVVGRRNYRYFVLFVLAGTSLALWASVSNLLALCWWAVPAEPPAVAGDAARGEFDGSGGWPGVVANNAGQTALLVYTFAVLVAPAILSGYHFQLIHRARTTNEDIRRVWQGKVNPHDNGLLSNCLDVLWAPTPPSHLLPRLDVLSLEPDDPEPSDGPPVPGAEQRSFGSPKRPGGRDEADVEGGGEPEWQGSPQRPAQPE